MRLTVSSSCCLTGWAERAAGLPLRASHGPPAAHPALLPHEHLSYGTTHPHLLPRRLAIEAGAPIVPVFAFGQTPHLRFWRPFIDWPAFLFSRTAMSRWAGFRLTQAAAFRVQLARHAVVLGCFSPPRAHLLLLTLQPPIPTSRCAALASLQLCAAHRIRANAGE